MGTSQPATPWHVLGAGAMGCLWAAKLSKALSPADVTLILRDETAMAQFPGHVTMETATGEKSEVTLRTTTPARLSTPINHLLVTTKAFDTETALEPLLPSLTPATIIVLLQNGIRNHLHLHDLTQAQTLSLTTSHGAWLRERFHTVHAGSGQAFIGSVSTTLAHSVTAPQYPTPLPSTLMKDMHIESVSNMEQRLWQKFAINCVINGLTVIHNCQNGELLVRPAAHGELLSLCQETESILNALGHLEETLYPLVVDVLQRTAANWSSTWQDVNAGRQTEIDEFNGYLCALAKQAGLACTANEAVYHQVNLATAMVR